MVRARNDAGFDPQADFGEVTDFAILGRSAQRLDRHTGLPQAKCSGYHSGTLANASSRI